MAPKFASKILVGAPNFASKVLGEKYPEFCPLNFRFDPKIGIFPQLLHLVITEVPKFFLLLVNLAGARSEFGGGVASRVPWGWRDSYGKTGNFGRVGDKGMFKMYKKAGVGREGDI